MACDAKTLLASAASNGFMKLSDRQLKMCVLYQLCNGPASATAAAVLASAEAQGYEKLSDRQLEECTLAVLCP